MLHENNERHGQSVNHDDDEVRSVQAGSDLRPLLTPTRDPEN